MSESTPSSDIAIIAAQERVLVFPRFDNDIAWQLGSAMRARAATAQAALSIEIRIGRQIVFHAATAGTAAINADWVRRKGNTAMHFGRSSYAVGRVLQRDAQLLADKYGVPESEYCTQGGGFPLRVVAPNDAAKQLPLPNPIGFIAVSGLPQREDHRFLVAALSAFLGITAPELPA